MHPAWDQDSYHVRSKQHMSWTNKVTDSLILRIPPRKSTYPGRDCDSQECAIRWLCLIKLNVTYRQRGAFPPRTHTHTHTHTDTRTHCLCCNDCISMAASDNTKKRVFNDAVTKRTPLHHTQKIKEARLCFCEALNISWRHRLTSGRPVYGPRYSDI